MRPKKGVIFGPIKKVEETYKVRKKNILLSLYFDLLFDTTKKETT
jgi:hypothetical protein